MTQVPLGEEREVKRLGGATLDGASIALVVALAAVVAVLSFIPFSVMLGSGGSIEMSEGIYGLIGWILGPIAGAVASGVGRFVGVLVAPHTAGVPFVSVWGAAIGSFAAGSMVLAGQRRLWWIPLTVLFVTAYLLYAGRAIVQNGVGLWPAIGATFLDWSGVLLFALPTRRLFVHWLKSPNLGKVAMGLFLGTWMISGLTHVNSGAITYFMYNWAEEVWIALIPVIPVENLFRCLIGMVIGTGVIVGLRAIGITKPDHAVY
ncbi:MAG: hypothetical protein MUF84_08445 [Anaerolineae bacterium]|jgi:hypothetical protein|nr:hypothetical protein [Anaerolineae bacterium]